MIRLANPSGLMISWFAWIIGPVVAFASVLFLPLYYLEVEGFNDDFGLGEVLLMLMGGLMVSLINWRYWFRSVATRRRIKNHLSGLGFRSRSDRTSIRAERDDLVVDIRYTDPFLDFKPYPRWFVRFVDGEKKVYKIGSFSPSYMLSLGSVGVIRRMSDEAAAERLARRADEDMKQFFREHEPLARVLANARDEDRFPSGFARSQGSEVSLRVPLGTWLGDYYLMTVDHMVRLLGDEGHA